MTEDESQGPEDRVTINIDAPGLTFRSLGREWTVPYAIATKAFDRYRDELFEDSQYNKEVDFMLIAIMAQTLLTIRYRLDAQKAGEIIAGAERQELVSAVLGALMGETDPVRKYSDWVRSTLLANGLRREDIPQEDLANVLFQLVKTGRAVPIDDYASIYRTIKKQQELLG